MPTRILVADDDESVVTHVRYALEKRGYEVYVASNGADAIVRAGELVPDVILLDIIMPAVDGFEVLERLRQQKIDTRIIMVSGIVMPIPSVVKCIRKGACDFLTKPYTIDGLADAIDRAVALDSTLSFFVADDPTPAIQNVLRRQKQLLNSLNDANETIVQLKEQKQYMKARLAAREVRLKGVYLSLSLLATLVLKLGRFVSEPKLLASVFVSLFLLLLIPVDRIRTLTASVRNGEAKIDLSNTNENV